MTAHNPKREGLIQKVVTLGGKRELIGKVKVQFLGADRVGFPEDMSFRESPNRLGDSWKD